MNTITRIISRFGIGTAIIAVLWLAAVPYLTRAIVSAEAQRTRLLEKEKAINSAIVGTWVWYKNEDRIWWNDIMFALWGVDPTRDGFVPLSTWTDSLHPDDRDAVLTHIYNASAQATPYHIAYRIIRPDGQCYVIQATGRNSADGTQMAGACLLAGESVVDDAAAVQQAMRGM